MIGFNFDAAEDTPFQVKNSLNCSGRLLDLSTPIVMGIVNLTEDSFYDGGKIQNEKALLNHVQFMLEEGAAIIDIGGQSTRPRATRITATEEWNRIEKSLIAMSKNFPDAIFSIDTFYSDVAEKALQNGASIINDISAGSIDERIYSVAAKYHAPYIAMHMQGEPHTMQENPSYENVTTEVLQFFVERIAKSREAGICDIVIDPGFGFGKTVAHNYQLLNHLELFRLHGLPILAGLSRKSMITRVLNVKADNALNGTIALNSIALLKGVSILRVHDVRAAMDVIGIVSQLKKSVL
jgi:dihydropteroate synthase